MVDNSAIGKQAMMEGRPPRCIQVYNKTGVGLIGKAENRYIDIASYFHTETNILHLMNYTCELHRR